MSSLTGNRQASTLYLIALTCYIINAFGNHAVWGAYNFMPILKTFLFSIIVVCLLLKIIFLDRYTLKELLIIGLILGFALIIAFKSGNRLLLTLFSLVIFAKNVNFRSVLLIFLITVSSLLLITFLLSIADIIPNLQYSRIRDGEIKIRNAFGTGYPTLFAAYLLAIIMTFSYYIRMNKVFNHFMFLFLAGVGFYLSLEFADARMSAYSILLYVCLFYFCTLFFKKVGNSALLSWLIVLIFPVGFLVIYALSVQYSPDDTLLETINSALSGRLRLAHQALETYETSLLGQEIKWVGLGGAVQEMGDDYNYVDSSFLQFMLSYGVLFSVLSLLVMMFITWKRIKLSDYRFIAIICLVTFSSMIEDRLLDISINIYWLLLFCHYPLPSNKSSNIT